MAVAAPAGALVLVVDDEASIVDLVKAYLEREGFKVLTAHDGPTALERARALKPDLIVLDVMLPGMDGLEVLREVRRHYDPYVILLTARSEETDKLIGLAVGADDYVTKPFSPRELAARAKTVLRRGRGRDGGAAAEPPLEFAGLRIDPLRREVTGETGPIRLTTLEFDILHALASHPGVVLTRERLLERVWGHDFYGDDRVVDVHIAQLRKKLGDDAANPRFIETVRGVGYKFVGARA